MTAGWILHQMLWIRCWRRQEVRPFLPQMRKRKNMTWKQLLRAWRPLCPRCPRTKEQKCHGSSTLSLGSGVECCTLLQPCGWFCDAEDQSLKVFCWAGAWSKPIAVKMHLHEISLVPLWHWCRLKCCKLSCSLSLTLVLWPSKFFSVLPEIPALIISCLIHRGFKLLRNSKFQSSHFSLGLREINMACASVRLMQAEKLYLFKNIFIFQVIWWISCNLWRGFFYKSTGQNFRWDCFFIWNQSWHWFLCCCTDTK